jgi:putative two-component system response regulator
MPHGESVNHSVETEFLRQLKVMVLDDEPYNCLVVRKHLRDAGYTSVVAISNSSDAIEAIHREQPRLLLTDIMMPGVSGLDIIRLLKADVRTRRLPVLVLTASTDVDTKRAALELGATDFLTKPVEAMELLPRVRNALVTKAFEDKLANYAETLEDEVRIRTAELMASRKELIRCLARAAEYRDDNTGSHVLRVGRYVGIIAEGLGFNTAEAEDLELAAQLHDLGKIGIPDAILNAPGKLDPETYALMQRHAAFGKRILQPLAEQEANNLRRHSDLGASLLGISSSPILTLAARIAQTHHEWWDGSGYPLGLAGDDIPLEGRITAVADVFDALSSARSYKKAFPREKCFAILREGSGTQFDPRVLEAFFARSEAIVKIQLDHMDVD